MNFIIKYAPEFVAIHIAKTNLRYNNWITYEFQDAFYNDNFKAGKRPLLRND